MNKDPAAAFLRGPGRRDDSSSARAPLSERRNRRGECVLHAGVLQGRMGRNLRIRETPGRGRHFRGLKWLVAPQNSTRAAVTRGVARSRTAERSVAVRLSRPFERSSSRRARVARPHGRLPFRTHRGKISPGSDIGGRTAWRARNRSGSDRAPRLGPRHLLAPSGCSRLAIGARSLQLASRPSGFPAIALQTKPTDPDPRSFPSCAQGGETGTMSKALAKMFEPMFAGLAKRAGLGGRRAEQVRPAVRRSPRRDHEPGRGGGAQAPLRRSATCGCAPERAMDLSMKHVPGQGDAEADLSSGTSARPGGGRGGRDERAALGTGQPYNRQIP